jgi:hypothetical protein
MNRLMAHCKSTNFAYPGFSSGGAGRIIFGQDDAETLAGCDGIAIRRHW